MTSQVIKNTFENTYRDDFKDSDNYHRILFNPARAVQARELTQSQTIIQREVERFGRNIFKEGASVNPINNVFIDNNYAFVKLQGVTTFDQDIVGRTFTGSTSGVSGEILRAVDAEGSDPATIFVAYKSGGSSGANVRFSAGETITDGSTNLTVQSTNTTANPATGNGTLASISSGEFFVLGHFVYAEASNVIVSKYNDEPSIDIGFRIVEDIVTASDDVNLYDNQGDLPNTTAPGADRYRIRLILTTSDLIDSDETFVYVAKLREGEVVDLNNGRNEYNRILDLLAERTYEESGNYTVEPPIAYFEEDPDSSGNLLLRVSKSISYVNGYRVETLPEVLTVPKPRSTETINNEAVSVGYGNYIEVDNLKGIPNLNTFEEWNLSTDSDYPSGSIIGTARVRAIEPIGSQYRFHLFDIQMNSGQSFRDTRSLGLDSDTSVRVVLERSAATLKDVINNDLLFPLPTFRPKTISDVSLTVQRVFTGVTDGSGELTINLTSPGEDYSSQSDWIVSVDSSGELITPTITPVTTTQTTITGAPSNTALSIFGFVRKGGASGSYRTKTLTTSTVTTTLDSDGNGLLYVDLGEPDIYQLDSARSGSSSGADISSKFRLDNGQRDNYYGIGRLVLNTGETAPSGNVYVKFQHFTHGGTGNFFCVSSYDGQVDYDQIPVYRQNNGSLVFLSDVLDFRSTKSDDGSGFSGTGARVNELPQNTEVVTADVEYYLPRSDTLVVDPKVGLRYILGESKFDTRYPSTPSGTMAAYLFDLNPNTLTPEDASYEFIDNRRYTMADIGDLDRRIEQVWEYATLSYLDLQASTFEVLDENGLLRTKAGFLTDNFSNQFASDIENEEYRASIQLNGSYLMPPIRENNVGLLYDSEQGSNTVMKGNMIMLDYTDELYQEQSQASRGQMTNPYYRIDFNGTIILSPAEDEWFDVIPPPKPKKKGRPTIRIGGGSSGGGNNDDSKERRNHEFGAGAAGADLGSTRDGYTKTGPDTWSK